MTVEQKILRAYLRTSLRGRTRVPMLLAQYVPSFQRVPITIADHKPFYIDLRRGSVELFEGSPWKTSPWEQSEQQLMRGIVREGDVVFDIGANIGIHSAGLSRWVGDSGHVYVFEPNGELLPQLALTVNGLKNATLYPFALSDTSESSTLFVPENAEMGSLADWTAGRDGAVRTMNCEVRRIDDLIKDGTVKHPDFIKCDIEGAELMAFRGARATLGRADAPMILFEANVHNTHGFGLGVGDAKDFLASLPLSRYRFFEVEDEGGAKPLESVHPVHSNILAVPEARLGRLPGNS